MNYKWNYQPPTLEQREAARALAKDIGISPILCRLLLERGITSTAEAKRFFRPQLNELHDPFLMKDMSIAVERLNKAMGRKERIMVYGDYDVDGTTAVALVYNSFNSSIRTSTTTSPTVTTKGMEYRRREWIMLPKQA